MQVLLAEKLAEAGLSTVTAADGLEASKFVENQKFSVIILDINLPIIQGIQIAERARQGRANRTTPIFVLSGFLTKEVLAKAQALNLNGVFAKPLVLQDFLTKVLECLKLKNVKIQYDPRIIKCFVAGSLEVLGFYFQEEKPKAGTPAIRDPNLPRNLYASAMIPFKSKDFRGSLALVLPVTFIKKWITNMFGDPDFKVDNEVIGSATGELCNQMLGLANANFAKIGIEVEAETPTVAIGKGHVVQHATSGTPIVVPIQIADIYLELEFCLSKNFLDSARKAEDLPIDLDLELNPGA